MEVFNTYLNNIFAAYQETEQALRLKESLLMTMEEKYRDLTLEGLSHDAAVGKVMSEFGTIDELADELVLKERTTEDKFKRQRRRNNRRISTVYERLFDEVSGNDSIINLAISHYHCVTSMGRRNRSGNRFFSQRRHRTLFLPITDQSTRILHEIFQVTGTTSVFRPWGSRKNIKRQSPSSQ